MPTDTAHHVETTRNPRRGRRWIVVIAAFLLLAGLGAWFLSHHKTQRVRLTGGNLELAQVSFGKAEHHFVCGSALDKLVHRLTPASWFQGVGSQPSFLKSLILRRVMGSLDRVWAGTNALVVWLGCSSTNSVTIRVQLRGEGGVYWCSPTPLRRVVTIRLSDREQHLRFETPGFPRRDPFFLMDIYELAGRDYRLAGSFRVANPAFQTYPTWKQPPAFDSAEVGNSHFVLQPIVNHGKIEDVFGAPAATFNLEDWQRGSAMRFWKIGTAVVSDATGNTWDATPTRLEGDTWVYSLNSPTPTNEVLKLRAEVWRHQHFASNLLWTIPDVPLPRDGQFSSLTNVSATRDGFTVEFQGIGGRQARVPGVSVSANVPFLQFRAIPSTAPSSSSWRLCFVDLEDEKGESLVIRGGIYRQLAISSDARTGNTVLPIEFRRDVEKARLVLAWSKVETIELFTHAQGHK